MAAGSERAGITPLGTVSIDRPVVERLIEARLIGVLDVAHAQEHSLEVQLAGGCAEEGQLSLVSMAPLGEPPTATPAAQRSGMREIA